MSQEQHLKILAEEHGDTYEIPVSQGIPAGVGAAFAACLLVVLAVMATVVYASDAGHVWPWSDAEKVPLQATK